ncbi:MAG: sigma-70 family RNA polymerase sigma factor [Clostridia bacterium]|nr:sigma-70 family RNA polymerase sigma factor [Clostridia bacterium]
MGTALSSLSIPNDRHDKHSLRRLLRAVEGGRTEEINQAFEDIYDAYVRLVAFVCGKYLSNDEDIKEVTNDVFVHFFNHLSSLDPEGEGLKYYLTVSAKNAALNYLRDQRRHRDALVATEEEAEVLLSVPDPDGEDTGASIRYRELIRDMASCMDKTALEIVLRHAVMGETFPTIGHDLQIKPSTVKTLYHRALAAFRREKGIHWT